MKKKYFERYFDSKIWNVLFYVSFALIAAGVPTIYFYWPLMGLGIILLGAVLFLVSSSFRVTEKDVDEKVAETKQNYGLEMINGKFIGRRELNDKDFTYFSGYICDGKGVRFKSGRDGKVRTSRYYVTAMCVEPGGFTVQCSFYDLFEKEKREDVIVALRKGEDMTLVREPSDFPRGQVKYTAPDGSVFWLPDDAVADDLINRIKRI